MRRKSIVTKTLALLLAVSIQLLMAQSILASPTVTPQSSGKLTTSGNQSILVNGNSMSNGGTVLSGATLETPPGVSATIDLGPLGSVDLAPGTTAVLDFSDGTLKLKLIKGCAIVRSKKGTEGEVSTEQGVVDKTDKENKGVIDVCIPPGGGPAIVNQGAAANAISGISVSSGGGGISKALLAVLSAGGAGAVILAIILNSSDS